MGAIARQCIALIGIAVFLSSARADGFGHYIDWQFPLRPTVLVLGKQEPATFPARLGVVPFFVVGTDPQSRQWLKRYGEHFRSLNAVGFVVQAVSEKDLAAFKQDVDYPALFVQPSDKEIAEHFGVTHYPVLVSVNEGKVMQ